MKKKNHIATDPLENFEFLDAIAKKEEFQIPKEYFSILEHEIQNKIDQETKVVYLPNRFKKWTWAAAIAASVIMSFYFINNKPTSSDCKTFACMFENSKLSDSDLKSLEEESGMELFENDDNELF